MPTRPATSGRRPAIQVDRARLTGARPGDRERLSSLLDDVSPASVGLGPRAILVVPRLTVSRPLSRGAGSSLFTAAVRDALTAALQRARRPGAPGSAGDCWLFEDDEELAAAVIRAWRQGGAAADQTLAGIAPREARSWWRRSILPDGLLCPRVVARLAQWDLAEVWLAALELSEIATAIAAIAEVHGLEPTTFTAAWAPAPAARAGRVAPRPSATAVARLRSACPELFATRLEAAPRTLLALALVAARRPALLSLPGFPRSLAESVRAAAHTPASAAGPVRPTAEGAAPPRRADGPEEMADPAVSLETPGAVIIERAPVQSLDSSGRHIAMETRFGGLLFLLNALLALGVYGDFTRPMDRLAGLSPCGLLLRLGRRWFGSRFSRDPLAAMLKDLSRDDPRVFRPPPWAPPQAWLAALPDDLLKAAASASRRLPAGAGARWIARLADYLPARLAAALGEDAPRAALRVLCRERAAIVRDDDRIEAVFSLETHPLAIRMAGLDRDPGWIPAAGLSFAFRFT